MKEEYVKRYKTELKFSERQLEQISAHHLIDMFMENNKLKDLSNINPKWIEQWKYKDFSIWYEDELKRDGVRDVGRVKIRKTKKGFVFEFKFKWISKGLKKTQYLCKRCKKAELVNFDLLCKRCTNYLKKKNKFRKFWENNPPILKCQKK
jgi:hypothetical protein